MRGKVYSSIVQASSTQNQGFFTTEQGTGNTLKHVFDLDMKLQTSGLSIFEDTTNLNRLDVLKKRILLGGDLGLGFDVGFTYQPRPEWTIDASLQDIGAINYNTDPKTYILDEYLEYEGINPEFPEFASSQNAQNYWDVISDSFDELFETDSTLSSYTKWRPIKLNSSVSYNFGKKIDKDYKNLAYTTILAHRKLENNSAIQVFTGSGPIAFLPISNTKTSVVCSLDIHNKNYEDYEIIKLINQHNPKFEIKKILKF